MTSISEYRFAPGLEPVAPLPWWRLAYWTLRREIAESRSIYIAPLAVIPLALAAFVYNVTGLAAKMRASLPPAELHDAIQQPYDLVAGLLMGVTTLVAIFYSVDSLYGERRDRSILFWKSMPVPDSLSVVVKAGIPIILLPLIGFVVTFVLHLTMALISSAVLAANGLSVAAFWSQLAFGKMTMLVFFHLITAHGLAWAPVIAWLMLVSASARRAPFVWAVLPPVVIAVVERLAFGTAHFAGTIGAHLSGASGVITDRKGAMPTDPMVVHLHPAGFFGSPSFWVGLLVTAIFLVITIRLRRRQLPA